MNPPNAPHITEADREPLRELVLDLTMSNGTELRVELQRWTPEDRPSLRLNHRSARGFVACVVVNAKQGAQFLDAIATWAHAAGLTMPSGAPAASPPPDARQREADARLARLAKPQGGSR